MSHSVDADAAGPTRFARLSRVAATASVSSLLVYGGALLVLLAGMVPWFAFPITGRVPGYSFPLWDGDSPERLAAGGLVLGSFGVASAVLAIVILAVGVRDVKARRRAFLLGGAALALGCCFLAQIVFRMPRMTRAAAEQQVELGRIARFSRSFLAGNTGIMREPLTRHTLDLGDRVSLALERTGLASFGMGWSWAVLGGLLVVIGAARGVKGGGFRRDALLLTLGLAALVASIGARTLIAELHLSRAHKQLAEGFTTRALARSQRALSWDPALDDRESFARLRGAALYRIGARDQPETSFFLGDNWAAVGDPLRALAEYRDALAIRPDWMIARRRISERLVTSGLELYESGNAQSAISRWESALELTPERLDARVFLATALFVTSRGDQSRALAEGELLLSRVREKLVRSDILNLLGDCYQSEGKLVEARSMYRRSLNSIHLVRRVVNANAQAGLQGM